MKIKKVSDFNLNSKKVLVRLDLNVPFDNGKVSDDTRIIAAIPTLKEIIKKKGIPIIISHFGRPEGKKNKKYSLKRIVKNLSKKLGRKVLFCDECIGEKVKELSNKLKTGQILLLENLRFHKEEKNNNNIFAKNLSKYSDIYINDAFSASHRKHASIDKITKFLPSGIGINMGKELLNLNKYLKKPKKPLVAIIGGAKMKSKISVIESLIKKCDYLILAGGIANTFLKSKKINVGKSIYEKEQLINAIKIQRKAVQNKCEIILPLDATVSEKNKIIEINSIHRKHKILDIGTKSIKLIYEIVNKSRTIIWSGPLGFFEKKPYDKSTNKLANLINQRKNLISIAGGGDTIAAIKRNRKFKNFTFLSTGGGAFLTSIEKSTLPGIEAIKNNKLV